MPHCGIHVKGESGLMNTMIISQKAAKSEKLGKTFYDTVLYDQVLPKW
jgi:hypothetical protein